jgi:DmsE family decaheme c-type cytochrome
MGRRVLTTLASVLPALVLTVLFASHSQLAAAQRSVAPEAETCKGCHADYVETYAATKHGQAGNVKGPDCQTCHANALEHAKAGGGRGAGGILGFNNKAIPAEKKSSVCLACHESNRHLAFWDSGKHRKNDVSCNNCHTLHGTPGPGATVALTRPNPSVSPYQTTQRQLQYETCTACHKQIRSQLLKPSHHPIIEGKVACSDCHNPHGALTKAMVKAESIPTLCTSCHAEKRGPFVWGHPPVEENCLACHNSHGSNHARLLAEKAPNVCQDCHDASRHPGTIYDARGGWNPIPLPPATTAVPNTRLIARGCNNCHYHVHGSNAPGMRGKFFLR